MILVIQMPGSDLEPNGSLRHTPLRGEKKEEERLAA
jgi:hypothetical protein